MRRRGDRAWWRSARKGGADRFELVTVIRGVKTTRVLPPEATTRDAAHAIRIIEIQLHHGIADAPCTWGEAVDAFVDAARARGRRTSTLAGYRNWLGAVGHVLGAPDPLALSAEDGRRHAHLRAEAGRSAATIKDELEIVTQMQRWCVRQGWLARATWNEVPRPEIMPRLSHLRPDQIGAFMHAAYRLAVLRRWTDWPAGAWLLLHGLRTSEAQHLLIGDVDQVRGILWIRDRIGARTKNRSSTRTLAILTGSALAAMRAACADRPDEAPVIVTGRHGQAAGGRTAWFARRCAATCTEAGVPSISPHGLRHTLATLAVEAGADMHSLAAFLGHADPRVTSLVYAHASSLARSAGTAAVLGASLERIIS